MQVVHRLEQVTPEILAEHDLQPLITDTYEVYAEAINYGIQDNCVPPRMAESLDRDAFIFSGMKVYNEVKEGSLRLRNDDGSIKPFDTFYREVQQIDNDYNESYLQAEYEFAITSAQMAAQWAKVERDGDNYNLQYRTAEDNRVRQDHQILTGTTLPPSDPFWASYYPPNGWRCRCQAVQVRKEKYATSNSAIAQDRGAQATADKGEIFRFNPGKQGQLFPPAHPYRTTKCGSCNSSTHLAAKIGNNEKCQACRKVDAIYEKTIEAQRREKYLLEMKPLLKKQVVKETDAGAITVKFTAKGNKHLYSDTFKRVKALSKEDLKTLDEALNDAEFVKSAGLSKERKDKIQKFYYFKDKEKELYYNVAEQWYNGRFEHFLYSATEKIKD